MITRAAAPLNRERYLILALLLILAAAAWAAIARQAAMPSDSMDLTMGMAAPLFLTFWVVMMVAMMFPTAAPMILTFSAVYDAKRKHGQSFVPTWVFVVGYLVVWTGFGAAAYVAAVAVTNLAQQHMWLADNMGRLGGILLILAGLYQLSPLKQSCLTKCRTPLEFVLGSWRDGYRGALRMGLQHGAYCLGCCVLLFAILFPLGIMNVAAMIVVTLLVFAEKSLPWGQQIGRIAAVALVVFGTLAVFVPALLPIA